MDDDFDTTAFSISLLARYANAKFEVYGTVGLDFNSNTLSEHLVGTVASTSVDATFDDSGTSIGFHIGAGAKCYFTDNVYGGASFVYLTNSQSVEGEDSYNLGGLSAQFALGYTF
ncbi:hypothetical protein AGMMS49941_12610 [Deferribacterales bacterium]|nr:hypothetical protein AGMMS49941_12610 [Deferribacterales bacterium]